MKILIVEDNRNVAEFLQRMFQNHETHVVSSLEGGIALVAEMKPDLVILDCLLDDTTEATQAIKGIPKMIESSKDTAILVYTGYGSDDLRKAAIAEGAIGLIKKGSIWKVSEIASEIKTMLANSKFPHLIHELEDILHTKL